MPEPIELARHGLIFNMAPAGYMHPSWLDGLVDGDVCRSLAAYPNSARYVSTHILESLGLSDTQCVDFPTARSRLAFLPTSELNSLFLYVGAALRRLEFQNTLDRGRISKLRQAIGGSVIDFTVNRVPFWGNIPEASFEPSDELSIRSSFVLVGLVHSVCPISIANRAYRDRFALKFVPEIAQRIEADTQQYGDVENSGNLPKVTRRVIKEFLPKWDHLFD